ncbi:glycosyltransferase family 2 protein [Oryzibacter oryziterrae]|uniref:glycosyltransferase family 2 protein n=1 Tax=Oryzibacter oryziterrae TaxID=2766474 RepID=UPI001F35A64C|nr:glycosyltransferase family 2 protein [Oryzibacter oryziterrae]
MNIVEQLEVASTYFSIGDARGLRRILISAFPDASDRDFAPQLVDLTLKGREFTAPLPPTSAKFVANIRNLRQRWPHGTANVHPNRQDGRREIGTDFDFLGARHEVGDWTIAQALAYLFLRKVKPTQTAAVVGTMRDDGLYALEWIAHYQALGFDRIVIYSNDNADGSEHLLRRLAEHGVIIFVESQMDTGIRPEVKAFDHALYFIPEVRECEWALFVDSDEFLMLAPKYENDIKRFVGSLPRSVQGSGPAAVLFEWLWFNSDMIFERRGGLLQERFQHAAPHWLTKPLVRLQDLLTMRLQHIPELFHRTTMVNSELQPVDLATVWMPHAPAYGGGRLNHYWPKSFQEYSLKKARGDTLQDVDNEYSRSFVQFFEWNAADTPESFVAADEPLLRAVRQRCEALRALDGIREAEAAVEQRFETLTQRYDSEGGLRAIYDRLLASTTTHTLPTS